jgi:hypothetical protein
MLYSQVLENEEIKKGLEKNGVGHLESPLLKYGEDFASYLTLTPEIIAHTVDNETIARRKVAASEQIQSALQEQIEATEKQMAPFLEREKRIAAIKPVFEKIISDRGGLKAPFASHISVETASQVLAEKAASTHDFSDIGTAVPDPNCEGLSELNAILKKTSIVRLCEVKTLEDVAHEVLYNSTALNLLK